MNKKILITKTDRFLKDNIKNDIIDLLKNKVYIISLIIICAAAFGFAITHFSMGIDDFGVDHYLNLSPSSTGNMLQQGRLMHIVFYYLTGLVDVNPYLNNFIAAGLLFGCAVLLTGFFRAVTNSKFTVFQEIIFSGVFVSTPIMAFKFIYDLDVVVTCLSYVCVVLAVIYSAVFSDSGKISYFLKAFASLMVAIGSYESFNAVYICTVFFVLILLSVYDNKNAKDTVMIGLKFAAVLIVAITVYYAFVKIAQIVTGNPSYVRPNLFNSGAILQTLKKSLISVAKKLFNLNLFLTVEFLIAAAASTALAVYYSVKKRNAFIFLLFLGFGFFTLATQIIQCSFYFRCSQTFNIFIAGIVLLASTILCRKNILKQVTCTAMVLLLIWQVKDINNWFYKDWANYQKNVYAIHNIATDLNSGYAISQKPVCFVNRNFDSFLMSWQPEYDQYEIGESPIVSSIAFLGDTTSPELIKLFEYQEYTFLVKPTAEQVKYATEYSLKMPTYPVKGYIAELDDIIIVNMGKNNQ